MRKILIQQGQVMPRWYGIAYWDQGMGRAICYPVPIHILIRAGRSIWYAFKRGFRPAWWEVQMSEARQEGYKNGLQRVNAEEYSRGYADGGKAILSAFDKQIEDDRESRTPSKNV